MANKKNIFCIILCVYFAINYSRYLINTYHHDGLRVDELIRKFGYPVEIHNVTSDGYILNMYRIPYGRKSNNKTNRIPILMMHGILHSAAEFVNLGPGNALSLLLVDKGYDVWLGNARGNTWSRKHVHLDPDKDIEQFWNFSLDEIALKDLPTVIDYICNTTGYDKIHYVGYSQGTTIYFMLTSEKPEYTKKIRLMSALAPAVHIRHFKTPFFFFFKKFPYVIRFISYFFNIHETFPHYGPVSQLLKQICDKNSIFVDVCLHYIFLLQGYSYEQTNMTMLTEIYSNLPAGGSFKQLDHLIQVLESEKFMKYDWGLEENLKRYRQINPPEYNLSQSTTPVAIYYGSNDWIIQPKDVESLVEDLPNVIKKYLVPFEKFNHNDFLHAVDAVDLLYNSVIDEIEKY